MDQPCKGSHRGGLTPGAGKRSAEEWAHYKRGELRCAYCRQYVAHDEKGRLVEHAKPG